MKSARKLIIAAGLFGLILTGCMEADFGIVRPFGAKQDVQAERFDNLDEADANAEATAEAQSKDDTASVAADGDAESSDPKVAALTKQIEELSSRTAKDKDTSKDSVAHDGIDNPSLKPAIARRESSRADSERLNRSNKSKDIAHVAADPAQAPADSSTTTDAIVGVNTPVGIVQPTTSTTSATPHSETTASPTPRPTPIGQPTTSVPEPTGSVASGASVNVEIVDVRPVVTPAAGNAVTSANQPADGDSSVRAANLDELISRLEKNAQQQPPHPEDTMRLRLLYLAAGQDEKAVAPIKDMDPIQAELLTAIVKTVASSRQAMKQTPDSSSAPSALTAADELRRLLGQQTGVTIPRIALVTKVTSYGDYEAISPPRFKAGNEIHAYVYTEIANFRSEPVDNDRLHTLLSQKVQVFDASGKMVWERHEKNIEDRVRTPRRDFFIPFPVHLPANLRAGDYVLKVTVEDRIGGSTDQQRMSFSIQ